MQRPERSAGIQLGLPGPLEAQARLHTLSLELSIQLSKKDKL